MRIYLWQSISIVLGFVSLFVVIPYLSSNKTIYGIYSVCTSLTIFFSYADLGFLSSGVKYAAEYYIKKDIVNEIKIVGFTSFIMVIVFLLINCSIIIFGCFPRLIIPEIEIGSEEFQIARSILFLLAVGCPAIIAQRLLNIIYTVRVEDYKFQRLVIIGSVVKILSVLYFFSNGRYRLVEYYAFTQIVNYAVSLIALFQIRNYGYSIKLFISSFRFDKEIFNKVKAITGASFLGVLGTVLYNELDQIAISNLYGVEAVALYAVAFSLMTFIRTFSALVYSPYTSRYNHFIGLADYNGLSEFLGKVIVTMAPVLVLPIVGVALYSSPFVISWVGEEYSGSAFLMSLLVLSYVPNFLTQPSSNYLLSTERAKVLSFVAVLLPIFYWVGIVILSNTLGVKSFALMKFLAPVLIAPITWITVCRDVNERGNKVRGLWPVLKTLVVPILFSVGLYFVVNPIMKYTHSKIALLFNMCIIVITILMSLLVSLFTNRDLRLMVLSYVKDIKNKIL